MSSTGRMNPSRLMLIALKFNEKINQQDLEGLVELMTDDHTFTDNFGDTTKGKELMKEGWKEFFEKYPDYRNIFTGVTVRDDFVVMVGHSTCSYKPLNGPSIWTAKIRGDRVSEWRVYWLDQR
ncbi:MAG: nuclear transport factor 2 family protein [Candidatus Hodarchaeota archaeon]